jgi:hypothetical protein
MKNIVRKSLLVLGSLCLLLLLVEIGWRLKGFHPYTAINATIEMEPGWMYEDDSAVGLNVRPGIYHIVELGEYRYTATIDSNHERITSYSDSSPDRPSLLVLGAGSTFGQGLNDNESFPFALQTLLPEYKVRNMAVMGYGLANNYAKLTSAKNLKKGDAVLCIYHADQNNRYNRVNRKRAQAVFNPNPHFKNFHYVSIDSNLQTHLHKFDYRMFPLSPYSALANYVEDSCNAHKDYVDGSNDVARKAILAMDKWCKERGVEFKLVCWKDDPLSLSNLAYLAAHGVKTYNIRVIIAFDDRPANELAKANEIFADSLAHYIRLEKP